MKLQARRQKPIAHEVLGAIDHENYDYSNYEHSRALIDAARKEELPVGEAGSSQSKLQAICQFIHDGIGRNTGPFRNMSPRHKISLQTYLELSSPDGMSAKRLIEIATHTTDLKKIELILQRLERRDMLTLSDEEKKRV